MQALIDFDGWRKWKDFSSQQALEKERESEKKKDGLSKGKKKNRNSMGSLSGFAGSNTKLPQLPVEGEAVAT